MPLPDKFRWTWIACVAPSDRHVWPLLRPLIAVTEANCIGGIANYTSYFARHTMYDVYAATRRKIPRFNARHFGFPISPPLSLGCFFQPLHPRPLPGEVGGGGISVVTFPRARQKVVKFSRGSQWLSISRVSFRKLPCFFLSLSSFSPFVVSHPRASGQRSEDRYDTADLTITWVVHLAPSPPKASGTDLISAGRGPPGLAEFTQRPFALSNSPLRHRFSGRERTVSRAKIDSGVLLLGRNF